MIEGLSVEHEGMEHRASASVQVAEVALPLPLRQHFDYLVPLPLRDRIQAGMRVIVNLGGRVQSGVVVGLKTQSRLPEERLKPIEDLPADAPLISDELLDFSAWLATYYFTSRGEILEAMLPAGLNAQFDTAYRLKEASHELLAPLRMPLRERLLSGAALLAKNCTPAEREWLKAQARKTRGPLKAYFVYRGLRHQPRMERWFVRTAQALPPDAVGVRRQTRRQRLLQALEQEHEMPIARARALVSNPAPLVRRLVEEGLLREEARLEDPSKATADEASERGSFFPLQDDQARAFAEVSQALDAERYQAFLLQGVTGSGKTEIYLHAVREVLSRGKTALVLVPEIALTASIVARFKARFGAEVAVLHSALPEAARCEAWNRIAAGKARIVVGARSALFAPLSKLALVVVDEEHDGSFKQDEAPRYHGRDSAVMRAYLNHAVVILGSATPALESQENVRRGKFALLKLPNRIAERPLPEVTLLDLKRTPRQPGSVFFSRPLVEALSETLARDEQAMLFLNRRGYASIASCGACKNLLGCAHCDMTLTYHLADEQLRCHHCGYARALPLHCPTCQAPAIRLQGIGTERIEEELRMFFPQARILRMDSDTLKRRGELERMLTTIAEKRCQIILGTQILSKGHDFPAVTLVGVILADIGLNMPDFRAAERTFQLLTQVAGRAGRGERPGRVLVQTYHPQHHAIRFACQHDSDGFAREELRIRKELPIPDPPFTHHTQIWVSSPQEAKARTLAQQVGRTIQSKLLPGVHMLGVAPAPLRRLNSRYRWMIALRAVHPKALHETLHAVFDGADAPQVGAKERIAIDMDAYQVF